MTSIFKTEDGSASPPLPQKASKQACDNCRRRKIKCNRAQPCDKCQRLLLSCSYCDVLQRKGPKFRTLYPLAPLQTLVSQYPTPPQSITDQASQSEYMVPLEGWSAPVPWNVKHESYSSPESVDSHYELSNSSSGYQQNALLSQPSSGSPLIPQQHQQSHSQNQPRLQSGRLSAMVILAHINVYLKYLYPIIPVLNPEHILNDSQQIEHLTAQRYAFITALCAATHVQLQLDAMIDSSSSAYHDSSLALSGIEILTEAINARNDCNNICEEVNLESLLTSFFLFAAYGNLDRHEQAWFFLNQATSMALTLGLHREATYSAFGEEEAEERRRVFWWLFVTERAYALQQAKPIMLRNSIRKPAILPTEDQIIQYGFYNLISIFEKITTELYDWIAIECDEAFIASMSTDRTNPREIIRCHNFSNPIPLGSIADLRNLNFAGTQQWLQAMAWKLSMSDLSQFRSTDALLPFHFPVLVAKAAMDVFQGSAVLQSIGGPERRGSMITPEHDVQNYPNQDIYNEEFIFDIMNILYRIRPNENHEGQSHHFSFTQTSHNTSSQSNQFFRR